MSRSAKKKLAKIGSYNGSQSPQSSMYDMYMLKQADHSRIDYLLKFRIVQEHLLYVIGMPQKLASETLLSSDRFFGQYGNIQKILINKATASKDSAYEGQCAVYIWYEHPIQVAIALKCLNGLRLGGRYTLKCSFGTSKYCLNYLTRGYCEA